ncbi:hypothetical protein GGI07_003529 [Coemansia sp. Benny D115]|nr:hypothetical protein GGI07_003529 [Coemansia sp. Benny D115]
MEPSDMVLLALGVICPPGSVALKRGLNREFIICMGLTLLFWIPGVAFSWYLIFQYPLENFRRRNGNGQYHTIEDGLRRHSLASGTGSGEESPYRSEEDNSRSTTMTSDIALQHQPDLDQQQQQQQATRKPSSSRGKKGRRSRKSSSGNSTRASTSNPRRSSNFALQEAARSYALRHQQRQHTNSVKKWFVDRFYFPDPTQVPPSQLDSSHSENHEMDPTR